MQPNTIPPNPAICAVQRAAEAPPCILKPLPRLSPPVVTVLGIGHAGIAALNAIHPEVWNIVVAVVDEQMQDHVRVTAVAAEVPTLTLLK